MHVLEACHQSARMVGAKRSARNTSPELRKSPLDQLCELREVFSPTLSQDEKEFLTVCYYRSDQEPRAVEILSEYLDRGVDVNVISAYSATALDLVCLTNSKPNAIDLVRLLLQYGADPNNKSSDSSTPLHKLIWTNHSGTLIPLMSLLIQYGADVNARQENDENTLHKLLRVNQTPDLLRAVRLLVESGIRINENGGRAKGFGSGLHILCETNQTPHVFSVARCLIESGTCVNLRDDKNNTVLHILCRYNQTENLLPVMRFVVETGMSEADVTAKNDQGQTALHVLCQYNQTKKLANVIEFLIQNRIHTSDTNSLSALSILCKYNQTDQLPLLMKLLIPLENVNQADSYGSRATHLCAQYQKNSIITSLNILADSGADLAAANSDGETVLHLACQYADKLNLFLFVSSLNEQLLRKMIDLPDALGRTPLHQAAKNGCHKTVRFLASFVGVRILDVNGKCFVNYLEKFVRQKGTPLCTCCPWDSCLGLEDIDILHRNLLSKPTVQSISVPCSTTRIEESIPTHIDQVYIFNATDNYIRPPQSYRWANLLQIWNNVEKKLDFTAVTAVAEIGMRCGRSCAVYQNCIWCHLQLSVSSYIRCLINEVEKFDSRFATQRLIFYGSSADRTKLFQLDEFDFLVVLSHFTENEADYGHVIYCGDGRSAFLNHENGRLGISSGRAVYYFYRLLRAATNRVDCFNIHVRDISFGETCTTLHLTFCGHGQVVPISIDITIGISRSNLLRPGSFRKCPTSVSGMSSSCENSEEDTEYLVPFRDKCGPPEWRASYPTLERDTLLQTGEEVRICYRVLKLMVLLCQQSKSSNANDEHQQLISQKTKPSTYCLKTCLFRYMEFNHPPWSREDTVSHCIGILEVFLTHPGVHLKSFFNPQLNVAYIDHGALAICSQIRDRLRACLT